MDNFTSDEFFVAYSIEEWDWIKKEYQPIGGPGFVLSEKPTWEEEITRYIKCMYRDEDFIACDYEGGGEWVRPIKIQFHIGTPREEGDKGGGQLCVGREKMVWVKKIFSTVEYSAEELIEMVEKDDWTKLILNSPSGEAHTCER